ncbi:hypothetical protein ACOSQ2_022818 [Xanthoceras sorbifolium]
MAKSKKGLFAWKIDLIKAYDKIQWRFIREVLVEIGVENKLLELIICCVSSVDFKVILNGEVSNSFTPGCGLRQGDPLSPYLFVLCIEKLSHLIVQKISEGTWKTIKVSREGPDISHLFFANDLIIFGHATVDQAEVIKSYVDNFCAISGQQVSYSKSRIFCSNNVHNLMVNNIASVCDSPSTRNLGKYLRVLLIHGRICNQTYSEIKPSRDWLLGRALCFPLQAELRLLKM